MTHDLHADGAAQALDAIRVGGNHLIVQVRQRLGMALDALDEGDFAKVLSQLRDAMGSVAALSDAQQYIAIADGSRLVPAKHLEVGMTLTNVGRVTELDVQPCANERCKRHITVKIGEHEMEFRGEQEVYVTAPDTEPAEPA